MFPERKSPLLQVLPLGKKQLGALFVFCRKNASGASSCGSRREGCAKEERKREREKMGIEGIKSRVIGVSEGHPFGPTSEFACQRMSADVLFLPF